MEIGSHNNSARHFWFSMTNGRNTNAIDFMCSDSNSTSGVGVYLRAKIVAWSEMNGNTIRNTESRVAPIELSLTAEVEKST